MPKTTQTNQSPHSLQIHVQSCHNCYQHPEQGHSQSLYIQKLHELNQQVKRTWSGSGGVAVTVAKSQGVSRLGAFEVRFRGCLVFSKLGYGGFVGMQDLVTIVLVLVDRSRHVLDVVNHVLRGQGIKDTSSQLCTTSNNNNTISVQQVNSTIAKQNSQRQYDLYSYLKNRCKSIKLPLKFVIQQIQKMVNYTRIQHYSQSKVSKINFNPYKRQLSKSKMHITQNQQNIPLTTFRPQILKSSINSETRFTHNSQKQIKLKKMISIKSQISNLGSRSRIKKQSISQLQNGYIPSNFPQQSQKQIKSNTPRNLHKLTRNSSINDSKLSQKQAVRISSFAKQQKAAPKYSYLSKQMDKVVNTNTNTIDHDHQFQFLQLSQLECQEVYNKDREDCLNEEQMIKRRIEEGLNFKLTANYGEKKQARKYSFEYKKLAEMLQKQIKQDQTQQKWHESTIQNKDSQISGNTPTPKQLPTQIPPLQPNKTPKQNQISSCQQINKSSIYLITMKELQSKVNLQSVQVIENQFQVSNLNQYDGNLGETEGKSIVEGFCDVVFGGSGGVCEDNEQIVANNGVDNRSGIVSSTFNLGVDSNQAIGIVKQVQKIQQIIYYQPNLPKRIKNSKIIASSDEIIQLSRQQYLELKNSIKMTADSQKFTIQGMIQYVYDKSPQIFAQIFQYQKYENIKLVQNTICKFVVCLFDTNIGAFIQIPIKIHHKTPNPPNIPTPQPQPPDWLISLTLILTHTYPNTNPLPIDTILRTMTGAPIVKISSVDLRKVKRVIADSIFGGARDAGGDAGDGRKGVVLGVGEVGGCQILGIGKHRDFLKAPVIYRRGEVELTKQYEEVAVLYQTLLLWLYKPTTPYSHTQFLQTHNPTSTYPTQPTTNPTLKLNLKIPTPSHLYLQFTEDPHFKYSKPCHVLICRVDAKNEQVEMEAVGEIYKNGSFFFEVVLQDGVYAVQVSRWWEVGQEAALHFASQVGLQIFEGVIDFRSISQFVAQI